MAIMAITAITHHDLCFNTLLIMFCYGQRWCKCLSSWGWGSSL